MKQTIEEAAKEYADDNYPGSDLGIRIMAANAFEAGAEWQEKQSPWISVEERLPEEDGYYVVTDGNIVMIAYYFRRWNKFSQYKAYPHPFYEEEVITAYIPIPPFNPSKPIKMYHDE